MMKALLRILLGSPMVAVICWAVYLLVQQGLFEAVMGLLVMVFMLVGMAWFFGDLVLERLNRGR